MRPHRENPPPATPENLAPARSSETARAAGALARWRFSLWFWLMLGAFFAVLLTFGFALWGARNSARVGMDAMARSLAQEVTARVERETQTQFSDAMRAAQIAASHVARIEREKGRFSRRDLPEATLLFSALMQANPRLSYVSVSMANSGEYAHVERRPDGLWGEEVWRENNAPIGRRFLYRFEGPARFALNPPSETTDYDPRKRPFFQAVRNSNEPAWTEPYLFVTRFGPSFPGQTYGVPVFDARGVLRYVVTADFTSLSLCEFLKGVSIGKTGTAFVLHHGRDGITRLLAHPDPQKVLLRDEQQTRIRRVEEFAGGVLESLQTALGTDALTQRSRLANGSESSESGAESAIRFAHDGENYLASFAPIRLNADPHLSVGIVVPERELTGKVRDLERFISLGSLLGLLFGALFSALLAAAIARPLCAIAAQARRVGQFELDLPPLGPSRIAEVEHLSRGVEQMKVSLRAFGRYVPPEIVRQIVTRLEAPLVGAVPREITVMFCNLHGFAPATQWLDPTGEKGLMSQYMGTVAQIVEEHGGVVDKFLGDTVVAYWNAPRDLPGHALWACRAAIEIARALDDLARSWRESGLPTLRGHIGVHTGTAFVGNMGSENRFDYTISGEILGIASRLENLNKRYGTTVLVSAATREKAGHALLARPIDALYLHARQLSSPEFSKDENPVTRCVSLVFEPLGASERIESRQRHFAQACESAIEAYLSRDFVGAIRQLEIARALAPSDIAVMLLLSRCHSYIARPPKDDWDGVAQGFEGGNFDF